MKSAYEIQIEKINSQIAKQTREYFENFKKSNPTYSKPTDYRIAC